MPRSSSSGGVSRYCSSSKCLVCEFILTDALCRDWDLEPAPAMLMFLAVLFFDVYDTYGNIGLDE